MTIHRLKRTLQTLLLSLAVAASAGAGEAGFKVIVNASNPVSSLTKDQVSRMFLKKVQKWDSGQSVVPVDQDANSPVRAVFSKDVHGKAVSAVASFWQQQIFAGRDVPPAEKAGDAAVLAFVRGNPNAIGYVSEGAATGDVKVVPVQ
jgi:ABC-type phosphate transport system substrate-binding protein